MTREFPFAKLSACGNDFVAADNRSGALGGGETELVRWLCDRRRGIGADGLLLVEEEAGLDFRMRIFNPDGSEARMCGNGARACAVYASGLGIGGEELRFSTRAGLQRARLEGEGRSRLWLSPPEARGEGEAVLLADPGLETALEGARPLGFLRMAVPHFVLAVDGDLEAFPIERVGPFVRWHAAWAPEGANVMFVRRLSAGRLELRAWEKGVEDETWGCGTGATAACLLLEERGEAALPETVVMKGGELQVARDAGGVSFAGEVHLAFEGVARVPEELFG